MTPPSPSPTGSRCRSRKTPGISCRHHVTDILTASEQEIIDAMKLTCESRMKIVMNRHCAVPLATTHQEPRHLPRQSVSAVIVTG